MASKLTLSFLILIRLASAVYTCDASTAYKADSPSTGSSGSSPSGSRAGSGTGTNTGSNSGSRSSPWPGCPFNGQPNADIACANWIGTQVTNSVSSGVGQSGNFRRSLQARAGFQCQDKEVCVRSSNAYLCVDSATYEFKDSLGGRGNLKSKSYTMANGVATSMASTATAWPVPTAAGANAAKASATGTTAAAQNTANLLRRELTGGALSMVLAAALVIGCWMS